ncbi:MAG: hypothetical protein BJ554DRAFT_4436 [Olpidium bornovanus]|uniref:Uncharacterized protein n=1 Tax=Olpidium bornovanus TaxID=278681 RepID=A0A8H7ZN24_9FUNG|nr:MAG: hypothetical protein BJ554DRAFT_4436 [Olpidium bornovanus]
MAIYVSCCKALRAFHTKDPPLAFRDLKVTSSMRVKLSHISRRIDHNYTGMISIQPANILIDSNGAGVLTDLGSVAPSRWTIRSRKEVRAGIRRRDQVFGEGCPIAFALSMGRNSAAARSRAIPLNNPSFAGPPTGRNRRGDMLGAFPRP